jgi:cellulose synthase/poly-beta-1,6-N-acetylglucosamine synthase-like glycosyltransferase
MLKNQKTNTLKKESAVILSKVEQYIQENPGAPFIIFFQVLLLLSVLITISGNLTLVEEVAVYAYPTLVIGIVLQLFSYLVHGKELPKDNYASQVEEDLVAWIEEESVEPVLSVVIPAYNEGRTIDRFIMRLENNLRHFRFGYELVVVDDGSTDNTYEVVKKIADHNQGRYRFIRLNRNGGKGKAFKRGYDVSRGGYILLMDADLEIPRDLLDDYLKRIRGADVVVASKRHPESDIDYGLYRSFLSRSFNLCVNILFNLGLDDTQCGFKLFKRDVLEKVMPNLLLKRYAFDVELLVNAKKKGFKIITAPIIIRNLRERHMKMREMFRMALDLLAVFYRLHFTKRYD